MLALPGMALIYINQVWVALVLAIICTRYRDVQQIVGTAMQIMLFATPIMWPVSALGDGDLHRERQSALSYDRAGPRADARQCSADAVMARGERNGRHRLARCELALAP